MAEGIKKISENVIVENRALVVTNSTVPDNDAISIGALQSNPLERGLKIKTSKGVYSNFDAAKILEDLSITTNLVANNCITQIKIAPSAVGHEQIEDDSVCEWKLKANSVTRDKIKNEEVIQGKLAVNSIINKNFTDNCITNPKIAENTIQNSKLEDYTITNKKIAQNTIINTCLADNSVSNSKINDNTIENNKYKDASIYGNKIANKAIKNAHLDINSVNSINILNGAVTGDKISDKSIYEKHIEDAQIIDRHIGQGAITETKIHDLAVSENKLKNKSVTMIKLGDDVIELIGDPVKYDKDNNVTLRKNLSVSGDIVANGTIKATKIYNAVFMDLAEAYVPAPDITFVPGDIVELREDGFVYKADSVSDNKTIVGVISNEYAQCFGATEDELATNQKVAVGMIGKVHVNVVGPVKIGEYIGACKDGIGVSKDLDLTLQPKHIIGKALESNDSHDPKKVLCLIFPN